MPLFQEICTVMAAETLIFCVPTEPEAIQPYAELAWDGGGMCGVFFFFLSN